MMFQRFALASMTQRIRLSSVFRVALRQVSFGGRRPASDLTRLSARALAAQLNPYELDGRQALQQLSQADLDALRNRFSEGNQPRLLTKYGELICLGGALGAISLSLALVVVLELHLRQPLLTLLIPALAGVTAAFALCAFQEFRAQGPRRLLNLLAPLSTYPSRQQAVLRDARKSEAARAYLQTVSSRRELIVADNYAAFRQAIGFSDHDVRSK